MLFGDKFDLEFFLLYLVLVANAVGCPSPAPQAFLVTVWSDDHELKKLCSSGSALAKALLRKGG